MVTEGNRDKLDFMELKLMIWPHGEDINWMRLRITDIIRMKARLCLDQNHTGLLDYRRLGIGKF
jgi:hypothetical protein